MELVPAKKLIVHTSEGRRFGKKAAYTAVLNELHRAGVRAVAVMRATAGFGASGKIATTMVEVLSYDLPIVVEATDTAEKIDAVLPAVLAIVADGVVEVRNIEIVRDAGESRSPD